MYHLHVPSAGKPKGGEDNEEEDEAQEVATLLKRIKAAHPHPEILKVRLPQSPVPSLMRLGLASADTCDSTSLATNIGARQRTRNEVQHNLWYSHSRSVRPAGLTHGHLIKCARALPQKQLPGN